MDRDKIHDGLLVLEHRSGNKSAFNLLVVKYHIKLCKHSCWYTKDIDVSKDIVQDCWKIILKKLDSLKEPDLFSSWAMRIVTRKSLDYVDQNLRHSFRMQEFQEWQCANREIDNEFREAEVSRLSKAIKLLTHEQQTVLKLYYTQEYSLKEIGTILDISIGTVKSRMFHAREKLKIIIKP